MEQLFPLTHCYNSIPEDDFIMFGADKAKGFETPDARHYLNLKVAVTPCNQNPHMKEGEVYSLQLGLTGKQMAEIVKYYFEDTVNDWRLPNPKGNIFAKMLRRLLVRRWKTMFSPAYWDDMKPYTELR